MTQSRPRHCALLDRRWRQYAAALGKNESGKTKTLVALQKQLDKWIKQRSLAQIFDWLGCIEMTNVQTVMGNYRWSIESVASNRLFLEYLGVPDK